jgi:hypothetical protein
LRDALKERRIISVDGELTWANEIRLAYQLMYDREPLEFHAVASDNFLHSISSASIMKLLNAGSIALISDITICKLEQSARVPSLDSCSWPCRIDKIHEQVRKHLLKTRKPNCQICTCAQSAAKNSCFSLTQQLSSR